MPGGINHMMIIITVIVKNDHIPIVRKLICTTERSV